MGIDILIITDPPVLSLEPQEKEPIKRDQETGS
jgi:hypothetical protein